MAYFTDEIKACRSGSFYPCMIVVQARMSSTRLPGKVLKNVLGKPLLFYLTERLRSVSSTEGIVIATTKNPADDPIVDFCNREGLHCIRGSEDDVLSRYVAACDAFGLEVAVRVTSDCPLIDPELIEKGLSCFRQHYQTLDYLSNCQTRTFARGMDFEIVRTEALKKAFFEATSASDKEHVTPYIWKHPELFRLADLCQRSDHSAYRLTVDTPEDFELIKRLLEELYPQSPEFSQEDIIQVLQKHPDWVKINAHVAQKTV